MSHLSPGIIVNGVKIGPELIDAEVQYHPASSLGEAKYAAMQALVIKELLVQRARELNLFHADEDQAISDLLAAEVVSPEPQEEELERYYLQNQFRFMTSPIFEASHILYLAPPDMPEERNKAKDSAIFAIERLKKNAHAFEDIAKSESGCSSKENGGHLGQIVKGQTMPEFEKALFAMQEEDVSAEPVETAVGYHVIKVHFREDGKQMTYDMVKDRIAEYLREKSWNVAFSHYVQFLINRAEVSGFRLLSADNPLLQ